MPGLDLRALGEFGLIEVLRRRAGSGRREWLRGIGDDAAVLRPDPGNDLVLTTDVLVEGVHFRWSVIDARSLGRKALAVNLSDLGAMGARPLGFLLSLVLPQDARPRAIDGMLRGLLAEAASTRCPLVGGDTVAGPVWMLSITALGQVPRGAALGRDGARPGDCLLVTGELGGAALGLRLLEGGRGSAGEGRRFVRRQLCPRPPYQAGPRLLRAGFASAAIDLSGGLARDLAHLLRESGLAADVHLDCLPLPRGMRALCGRLGLEAEELALHGGEDYELLFCVRSDAPPAAVLARRLGCRVTQLGVLRAGRGARYLRAGRPVPVKPRGFDHFKPISSHSEK
jgi:thiamine-monophosphate kinase